MVFHEDHFPFHSSASPDLHVVVKESSLDIDDDWLFVPPSTSVDRESLDSLELNEPRSPSPYVEPFPSGADMTEPVTPPAFQLDTSDTSARIDSSSVPLSSPENVSPFGNMSQSPTSSMETVSPLGNSNVSDPVEQFGPGRRVVVPPANFKDYVTILLFVIMINLVPLQPPFLSSYRKLSQVRFRIR